MSTSNIGFKTCSLPNVSSSVVPADLNLAVPTATSVPATLVHYLVYIPWQDSFLSYIPLAYRQLFNYVLPYLHVRTTDVHIAMCTPFIELLCTSIPGPIDKKVVYVAFFMHDIGWSKLTDEEIASSLGVKGLVLNKASAGPKEKHAIVGRELAEQILSTYPFNEPLTNRQSSQILDAVLYHDKPWELADNGSIDIEVKLVCDVDHLWSFTHQNFWQDTVRKGVAAYSYAANLASDLEDYFITGEAKSLARKMLSERLTEADQLSHSPAAP